jgi:hypothetical protein
MIGTAGWGRLGMVWLGWGLLAVGGLHDRVWCCSRHCRNVAQWQQGVLERVRRRAVFTVQGVRCEGRNPRRGHCAGSSPTKDSTTTTTPNHLIDQPGAGSFGWWLELAMHGNRICASSPAGLVRASSPLDGLSSLFRSRFGCVPWRLTGLRGGNLQLICLESVGSLRRLGAGEARKLQGFPTAEAVRRLAE